MHLPLPEKMKSFRRNDDPPPGPPSTLASQRIRLPQFTLRGKLSKHWNRKSRLQRADPDPESDQLDSEVQSLREADLDLKKTLRGLEGEIEAMERKLNEREDQRKEMEGITKELSIAQRFLSTTDSLSQAEVVGAMESLNEEIFQLTSILAEKVQVAERQLQGPERLAMFRERVLAFGAMEPFLEVVESKHLEDVTAIQIGWQAILVCWCSEIIQAWVVAGTDSRELNQTFNDIYKGIVSKHEQAVAGRWRAIAWGVLHDVSQEIREKLPIDVIRALVALPVVCGYIFSQKQHDELCKEFEQRIGPLIDHCLKFQKAIGEGIVSTNIRPYFCASGEVYNPEYVDLEYEEEKNSEQAGDKQGIIGCPLGLGLSCAQTSRNEEGIYVELSRPILKPKVILQQTLKEIIA